MHAFDSLPPVRAAARTRYLALAVAAVGATLIAAGPSALGAQGMPAAPKAYVGLFKDNAVAVIDTATNKLEATIPVPPGPHGLVVTPDGRWVYASSAGASSVSVIDTSTDQVNTSIDVGQTPHGCR